MFRPTNHRIAELEQENDILRQQCTQLRNSNAGPSGRVQSKQASPITLSSPSRTPLPISRIGGGIGLSRNDSSNETRDASHPEVPENDHRNISLYHGPTSTVYDDTSPNYTGQNRPPSDDHSNEEMIRHLLFSQTARQSKLCAIEDL
jgi:hypothetical protein